ncbi:MAG: hypothetical protein ABI587_05760 [Gemmatimonadales bacterium]
MFRVMLWGQWKWSRLVIALGSVAAFTLPVLSVRGTASVDRFPVPPAEFLGRVGSWGALYPILAATLGLLVAMAAWAPDHRGRHVHALSLPIPRWRYAFYRFGAGVVLLCVPLVALLIGALLATATVTPPAGIHAYPVALTIRFALALLIAFAVIFAVSGGTARTAGFILSLIAALIVLQVVASVANVELDMVNRLQTIFIGWAGPFAVFNGRWMLFDV